MAAMTAPRVRRGSAELRASLLAVPSPTDERTLAPRTAVPSGSEAAVTVLFREGAKGLELLLIERAKREGDPWSGQMAFPGGRRDPEDRDMEATALRELLEEVSIPAGDLEGRPIYLGERPPANRPQMSVSVFLAVLRDGSPGLLTPSDEVNSAFWAPLSDLRPTAEEIVVQTPRGPWRTSALLYERHAIWGFTRRVLLDVLANFALGVPASR